MHSMFKPAHDTEVKNGQRIDVVRVVVNTGHLSADNGAHGPMNVFFDIAAMTEIPPEMGDTYGQDCLLVPTSDWPTVESLLKETKVLYRLAGHDQPWQNIQSEQVRKRLTA